MIKKGLTIEDALPMIELSRKKKDKRVFGVLGNSKRKQFKRPERLIVNSVLVKVVYGFVILMVILKMVII
jgi:hypothetical protein